MTTEKSSYNIYGKLYKTFNLKKVKFLYVPFEVPKLDLMFSIHRYIKI